MVLWANLPMEPFIVCSFSECTMLTQLLSTEMSFLVRPKVPLRSTKQLISLTWTPWKGYWQRPLPARWRTFRWAAVDQRFVWSDQWGRQDCCDEMHLGSSKDDVSRRQKYTFPTECKEPFARAIRGQCSPVRLPFLGWRWALTTAIDGLANAGLLSHWKTYLCEIFLDHACYVVYIDWCKVYQLRTKLETEAQISNHFQVWFRFVEPF